MLETKKTRFQMCFEGSFSLSQRKDIKSCEAAKNFVFKEYSMRVSLKNKYTLIIFKKKSILFVLCVQLISSYA